MCKTTTAKYSCEVCKTCSKQANMQYKNLKYKLYMDMNKLSILNISATTVYTSVYIINSIYFLHTFLSICILPPI